MSLINLAAQLFISKLGSSGEQLEQGGVVSALQNLLPTEGGELDLGALVSMFTENGAGLASLASSWLGGGDNASISPASILELLGSDQVAEFAGNLGLGQDTAAEGLAEMIPELIDSNSEDGALAMGDMAKGLLGKLF
ncbi:YidB family protein [Marinobacterium sp. YM272]|uniref:YidB family protein n=1 Tax=Marinobacterium sp. YM272 TaxID=3421654 RepID=UPI003D7FD3D8